MKTKKLIMNIGFLIIVYVVSLGGCICKPEVSGNVPNTLRPQETNNWCWAATTQMLAGHYGISVTQCELANHRFGKTNCCDEETSGTPCPKTDDCNTAGNLELDFVGLKGTSTATGLSWENLTKQIYCKKRPMAYGYGTEGVVGHILIIKGYITLGGINYVILNDPWLPCNGAERIITYDEYLNPAGSSTHWVTCYNVIEK